MSSTIHSVILLLSATTSIHRADATTGDAGDTGAAHVHDPVLSQSKEPAQIEPCPGGADCPQQEESPWSHEPFCVPTTSLKYVGKKYCVYTASEMGPTGMSIVMDPTHALEASFFLDDNPLDSFLTREQAERLFYHQPPYEIKETDEKGMGVIARRRISRSETVMVDQASLAMAVDVKEAVGRDMGRKLLWSAVERLRRPEVVRALSWKHSGAMGEAERGEGGLEEDILQTNAFASEIGGVDSRALFPLVSRINHACNPNVFVLFSRTGTSVAVKAYRDIEPGEELTLSYLTLGQTSSDRHAALARWGFTCTCPLCQLSPAERARSDTVRTQITGSDRKIIRLWHAGMHSKAIALAENTCSLLARMYAESGKRSEAEVWAKRSFEWLWTMGFLGKDGEKGSGWEDWELERFLDMVEPRLGAKSGRSDLRVNEEESDEDEIVRDEL